MRHASIALMAVSLAACQSTPPSSGTSTADPETAIQNWVAAVNSCDAERIAMLYAPDAVLWGTTVPVIISSPAGVRQYFERTCSSNPKLKVALGEQILRTYGDTAINSGSYTVTVFPAGQPVQFPARYSFTYRKSNGRWLIVDHHSSALPSPAPVRQ
jgi:uncharacterized protein (TIGR02246 family)